MVRRAEAHRERNHNPDAGDEKEPGRPEFGGDGFAAQFTDSGEPLLNTRSSSANRSYRRRMTGVA
jgi:hypothetical protein